MILPSNIAGFFLCFCVFSMNQRILKNLLLLKFLLLKNHAKHTCAHSLSSWTGCLSQANSMTGEADLNGFVQSEVVIVVTSSKKLCEVLKIRSHIHSQVLLGEVGSWNFFQECSASCPSCKNGPKHLLKRKQENIGKPMVCCRRFFFRLAGSLQKIPSGLGKSAANPVTAGLKKCAETWERPTALGRGLPYA